MDRRNLWHTRGADGLLVSRRRVRPDLILLACPLKQWCRQLCHGGHAHCVKQLLGFLTVLLLIACGQAAALPADHPANPAAQVPAFQPTDYFAGHADKKESAMPDGDMRKKGRRQDGGNAAEEPALQKEDGHESRH